jgi:hypothetical protein
MKSSSSTNSAKLTENSISPASSASDRVRLEMSITRTVRHANKVLAMKTIILVYDKHALPVVCVPNAERATVNNITAIKPTTAYTRARDKDVASVLYEAMRNR